MFVVFSLCFETTDIYKYIYLLFSSDESLAETSPEALANASPHNNMKAVKAEVQKSVHPETWILGMWRKLKSWDPKILNLGISRFGRLQFLNTIDFLKLEITDL